MAFLNISNPIIITDKGLSELGLVNKLLDSLKKDNFSTTVFNEVQADPPEQNIFDAVSLFKKNNSDGVIGFGGGSSMLSSLSGRKSSRSSGNDLLQTQRSIRLKKTSSSLQDCLGTVLSTKMRRSRSGKRSCRKTWSSCR